MILESVAIIFSTGILIIASILPYLSLKKESESPRSRTTKTSLSGLSICNCFACGIFLGTCFLGLIPHVSMQEKIIMKQLNVTEDSREYPYLRTEVVILVGFLLILIIEQVCLGLMLFVGCF